MNAPAEPTPPASPGRTNVAAVEGAYQLLLWLIPVLDGMPRRQKFQLGDKVQATAIQVLDDLIAAAYNKPERAERLQAANLNLERLRFWIRLAHDLRLLEFRRYEHAARLLDALGRQVGGWARAERSRGPWRTGPPGATKPQPSPADEHPDVPAPLQSPPPSV